MRKLWAILLCLVMVIGCMPGMALAEGTSENPPADAGTATVGEHIKYDSEGDSVLDLDTQYPSGFAANGSDGAIQVTKGTLTINGSNDIQVLGQQCGEPHDGYAMAVWAKDSNAKVIINGGYYTNEADQWTNDKSHVDLIYASNGATIEINGGKFQCTTPKWTLNCKDPKKDVAASQITVKGGEFYQFNPAEPEKEGQGYPGTGLGSENEVVVPTGYKVIQNGDWYKVVEDKKISSIALNAPTAGQELPAAVGDMDTAGYKGNVTWTANGEAVTGKAVCGETYTASVALTFGEEYSLADSLTGDWAKVDGTENTVTKTFTALAGHSLTKVARVEATYDAAGNIEHWHCANCGKNFNAETDGKEIADVTIPKLERPAPPAPPAPPAEPDDVINDSADKTTSAAPETTVTADGKATAEIGQDMADKIVDKAAENNSTEIILDVSTGKDSAAAEVKLPAETIKELVEKTDADIIVKADAGEMKLDQKAAEAVADAAQSGTVSLTIEKTKDEDNEMHFELKIVTANGAVHDFKGGSAEITVKLNKALQEKNAAALYVDDNNRYSKVNGQKNSDGTFTFTTGHFSAYVIMEETAAEEILKAQEEADETEAVKAEKLKIHSSADRSGIKLSWQQTGETALDGFEIYRGTNDSENLKLYGETAKTTYKNTKVKYGNKYYYQVRGYKTVGGEKIYTDWSKKIGRSAQMTEAQYSAYLTKGVQGTKIYIHSKAVKGGVALTWSKSNGFKVDGYEVWRSAKKTTGFKKYGTTKNLTYKNMKNVKKGKAYYYKVRGYRTIDGKKIYTKTSITVGRTVR